MKNRKTISIICPPDLPIPPHRGYGGIQRSAYDFINELNRRGKYDITLFAPGDSEIKRVKGINILTNIPNALWGDLVENRNFLKKSEQDIACLADERDRLEIQYIAFIKDALSKNVYDIILLMYDNIELLKLLSRVFKKNQQRRFIISLRNAPSPSLKELVHELTNISFIALSEQHKKECGDYHNIQVINWGVNISIYKYSASPFTASKETPHINILKKWKISGNDYLLIIGAIGRHKGQATAIKIANKANINLIVVGTPQDRHSLRKTNYFKNAILPYLSDKIFYFGNADEKNKMELLRFAKALIFLSGFEMKGFREPFGRVMVEAMACGTPVLGFNYGSPINIIKDRVSGRLFNTEEEAVNLIKEIGLLDRFRVCQYVKKWFNIKRVVDDYEQIFRKIINQNSACKIEKAEQ